MLVSVLTTAERHDCMCVYLCMRVCVCTRAHLHVVLNLSKSKAAPTTHTLSMSQQCVGFYKQPPSVVHMIIKLHIPLQSTGSNPNASVKMHQVSCHKMKSITCTQRGKQNNQQEEERWKEREHNRKRVRLSSDLTVLFVFWGLSLSLS